MLVVDAPQLIIWTLKIFTYNFLNPGPGTGPGKIRNPGPGPGKIPVPVVAYACLIGEPLGGLLMLRC